MSKQAAIDRVNQFASQTGAGQWPNIDRTALANGLIERINNPNRIAQRATPLCGPATLIRAVATDDPLAYAQAAIDLYDNGRARIRNLDIRPGSELKASAVGGRTNTADWILLASVRDSGNWFFSPAGWFGSNVAGITRPATMEQWFRNTGYTDVTNITYLALKPIPTVVGLEAQRAGRFASQGYKVAMFIDADMLNRDNQDDLLSMHPDHWVTLTSTIRGLGTTNREGPVSFTVYSWGRNLSVPVDPRRPLSRRNFLHKYYGFIAGRH